MWATAAAPWASLSGGFRHRGAPLARHHSPATHSTSRQGPMRPHHSIRQTTRSSSVMLSLFVAALIRSVKLFGPSECRLARLASCARQAIWREELEAAMTGIVCVLLDANSWISERLLRSGMGAAL